MRGWGITLIIMGLGSLVLPRYGMQLLPFAFFEQYQPFVGIGSAIVGGLMAVVGKRDHSG